MNVSKNNLIIWLLAIILFSCSQEGNKSSSNLDENQQKEELLNTNLNALPKFPFSSISSPDSSFAVDLLFNEKQLDKFIIYYSNDTNYSFSIKLPLKIIGEMNYKTQIWENDTSLFFPNVGETPDGVLQLYIYKHGNYRFKLKKTNKNRLYSENLIGISENETVSEQIKITKQSTFKEEGEMLKFEYNFSNSGPRNIGCGGSTENWSFYIPSNISEFEYHKQEIEESKFEYNRSGGNNLGHLIKIVSGTIKGKYFYEKKWEIILDLNIIISDAHGQHEIQIKQNQIFIPK